MKTIKTIKTIVSVVVVALLAFNTSSATEKNATKKAATYKVDASKSVVKWHAKKVTGEHFGTVNLANGTLTADGAKVTGGSFELDMTSIKCTDITDANFNAKLVGHQNQMISFRLKKILRPNL
ncbi:MAG: hypothetical protein R2822_18130 [Spirosomataceae bacterium]